MERERDGGKIKRRGTRESERDKEKGSEIDR